MELTKRANALAKELFELLQAKNKKITFAESCTAGLCAATFAQISGASAVFEGSFVTYSESAKQNMLGVRKDTLEKHTVYSSECATEMAKGALKKTCADISLAITGIAGPHGATNELPVGTVFIALASDMDTTCKKVHFDGDRQSVRYLAVCFAFEMAISMLSEDID